MATNTTTKSATSKSSTAEQARDAAREKFADATDSAASTIREAGSHYVAEPAKDVFGLLREYAKDKPDVAAMWAFGFGVLVGWRLRG